MTICFLTPYNRDGILRPPVFRPIKKPVLFDDRHTISVNQFNQLPADKKAGFLLLPENNIYIKKYNAADSALRREAAHRLVEDSKSPTQEKAFELAYKKHKFLFNQSLYDHPVSFAKNAEQVVENKKQITPHGQVGCSTVIQFREWADEWRIRTQVETFNLNPPTQAGERISELLSQRGAKKIAEACEFMATQKGGFKTFVTGTFDESTRQKIKVGETTIQKEVSRTMDALQKMYQRGWSTSGEVRESVAGHSDGLAYCWVVEVPLNENGEENPHIHMLLGWSVPYRLFADWSARIEKIWGNGYFHLEKIKDCACAGAYMAKAAGYMTKGQDSENSQGKVRGNRYGISATARAPGWVTIGKAQLHSMGQIIADVYDHLTVKYGEQYRERKILKDKLDATPKAATWTRQKIGERLEKVRAELKKLPVRCNKYQIILKGRAAADMFISWAKGERVNRPEWLPHLPGELSWQEGHKPVAGDSHYFRKLKAKFQWIKRCRNAFTNEMCAQLVDRVIDFKNEALGAWESYNLDLCQ